MFLVRRPFLDLAKKAHHELLKDKMKKAIEAKLGPKLDQIAEAAVSTAIACMQNKMAEKHAYEKYEEALMAIFKS